MAHLQNTTRVTYRLLEGDGPVTLVIRPAVHFRGHDEPVSAAHPGRYVVTIAGDRFEISAGDFPPLRLALRAALRPSPSTPG